MIAQISFPSYMGGDHYVAAGRTREGCPDFREAALASSELPSQRALLEQGHRPLWSGGGENKLLMARRQLLPSASKSEAARCSSSREQFQLHTPRQPKAWVVLRAASEGWWGRSRRRIHGPARRNGSRFGGCARILGLTEFQKRRALIFLLAPPTEQDETRFPDGRSGGTGRPGAPARCDIQR